MIESNLELLRHSLQRWRHFEECLLHDLRLTRYGFGFDLVFNYVWANDEVRGDALERPILVVLMLQGVESLHFVGGLTQGMIDDPSLINWGLSEVACVEPIETENCIGISVKWESERRLDVMFRTFEINEPQ